MSDRKQDVRMAGVLAVFVAIAALALFICASVAVGMFFGAQWGWTLAALFSLATIALCMAAFKSVGRE